MAALFGVEVGLGVYVHGLVFARWCAGMLNPWLAKLLGGTVSNGMGVDGFSIVLVGIQVMVGVLDCVISW